MALRYDYEFFILSERSIRQTGIRFGNSYFRIGSGAIVFESPPSLLPFSTSRTTYFVGRRPTHLSVWWTTDLIPGPHHDFARRRWIGSDLHKNTRGISTASHFGNRSSVRWTCKNRGTHPD